MYYFEGSIKKQKFAVKIRMMAQRGRSDKRYSENSFGILANFNDEDFPGLSAPKATKKPYRESAEKKYVLMKNANNNGPALIKFSHYSLKKNIDKMSSGILQANFNREGNLVLLVNSETAAEKIIKTRNIKAKKGGKEIPLEVESVLHPFLNRTKGVAFSLSFREETEEDLLEALKDQGVIEVKLIKRNFTDKYTNQTELRNTGLAILVFNGIVTPPEIKYAWSKIEVRKYIPNPMKCRKCHLLGHLEAACTTDPLKCHKCGTTLENTDDAHECTRVFCLNCEKDGHDTSSKDCPTFKMHREWEAIRVENNVSKKKAQIIYKARKEQESQTYAQAATNKEKEFEALLKKTLEKVEKLEQELRREKKKNEELQKVCRKSSRRNSPSPPPVKNQSAKQNTPRNNEQVPEEKTKPQHKQAPTAQEKEEKQVVELTNEVISVTEEKDKQQNNNTVELELENFIINKKVDLTSKLSKLKKELNKNQKRNIGKGTGTSPLLKKKPIKEAATMDSDDSTTAVFDTESDEHMDH